MPMAKKSPVPESADLSSAKTRLSGLDRRQTLLDAAATLFAESGYVGASMRDIAKAAGILSGSVYYYFPSKDELLLAVHEEGVRAFHESVHYELARAGNTPWKRLEAACAGYLKALLTGSPYTKVVAPETARQLPQALRDNVVGQRRSFEMIFRALIDALPLPEGTDRRILRLSLLGSLNWTQTWYRPNGPQTPQSIAGTIVSQLRQPLDTARRRKG